METLSGTVSWHVASRYSLTLVTPSRQEIGDL